MYSRAAKCLNGSTFEKLMYLFIVPNFNTIFRPSNVHWSTALSTQLFWKFSISSRDGKIFRTICDNYAMRVINNVPVIKHLWLHLFLFRVRYIFSLALLLPHAVMRYLLLFSNYNHAWSWHFNRVEIVRWNFNMCVYTCVCVCKNRSVVSLLPIRLIKMYYSENRIRRTFENIINYFTILRSHQLACHVPTLDIHTYYIYTYMCYFDTPMFILGHFPFLWNAFVSRLEISIGLHSSILWLKRIYVK